MFSVRFFRTTSGNEPVREWLKSLDPEERRVIGFDLRTVERGFPIGMPLCRFMRNGLYEVRSSLPSKKEARLLFFQQGSELIVVAGFIKKSQKTPDGELSLARCPERNLSREGDDGAQEADMNEMIDNPHRGSSLESFLQEEGFLQDADNASIKRIIAWQIRQEMDRRRITKTAMARLMETSRTQLDRLLNPDDGNVTINTIERAAAIIGRKVRLELS